MNQLKLNRYLLFLIFYTLLVILWGAWVRISGSGDGCGDHWPLCQGEILPSQPSISTLIEKGHRLSTALYGLLILALIYFSHQLFPKGHRVRKYSWFVLLFTILEALIGAKIVLFGLVTTDASTLRAVVMSIHLVNTFLLTGSLSLAWLSTRNEEDYNFKELFSSSLFIWGSLGLFLVGGFGAVASLSTTLFPSESLFEGLAKDLSSDSNPILRLRILHPIMASLFSGLLFTLFSLKLSTLPKARKKPIMGFLILIGLGFVLGFLTLLTLSPLALKLIHLTMAHLIWMSFIWACLSGLVVRSSVDNPV